APERSQNAGQGVDRVFQLHGRIQGGRGMRAPLDRHHRGGLGVARFPEHGLPWSHMCAGAFGRRRLPERPEGGNLERARRRALRPPGCRRWMLRDVVPYCYGPTFRNIIRRSGRYAILITGYTPMKRRCAKLRSSFAFSTLLAAVSMSYSMRLNSKRFASL